MNMIVATSSNWGIGYKNELLFRISPDLKRFKELTMGKALVMGHNTFLSLPNQKPLPGRKNIVISKNPSLVIPGVYVANSKEQVMEMVQYEEVFIIGGAQVYELFLDDSERIYLTNVRSCPEADCFFPNLDKKPKWHLVHESELQYADGYEYQYREYVKGRFNMDFFKAVELRHSYRGEYTNDAVPEADIIKIIDAGQRAPSGCNAQTTSYIIVTNKELREKIAAILPLEMTKTAPVLVMVLTEKVTFEWGFDCEIEDYGAAVENILLATTALGYASCWLDGQLRDGSAEKIADILDVPKGKTVRTILPIGVPASEGKQAERKPFDERVKWFR